MAVVNLDEITLYDIAKDYGEENPLIGDFRHPMWQRFAMIALKTFMKHTVTRPYAFQLSSMIKTNEINGEVISCIIDEINDTKEDEVKEAVKILAAIRNI